jgi:hypothetical protein
MDRWHRFFSTYKMFVDNFTGVSCKSIPEGRCLLTYTYHDRTIELQITSKEYDVYQKLDWYGKADFWLNSFKRSTDYKKI